MLKRQSERQIINEAIKLSFLKPFVNSMFQKHHRKSTIFDHSLHVAEMSAKLGDFFEKLGIKYNKREAIRASLMHDIGVVGNRNKGKKALGHCLALFHPIETVRLAENAGIALSENERNIILSHMFPLSFCFPHSIEAWSIAIIDKIVPFKEFFAYLSPLRRDVVKGFLQNYRKAA